MDSSLEDRFPNTHLYSIFCSSRFDSITYIQRCKKADVGRQLVLRSILLEIVSDLLSRVIAITVWHAKIKNYELIGLTILLEALFD